MTKIGYLPYSNDFSEPGDRRRFIWFANEVKLDYELLDFNQEYDVIYAVCGTNHTRLLNYLSRNPKTQLIFEIVDAHLHEKNIFKFLFRGLLRFFLKKEDCLFIRYNLLLKKVIMLSSAVVCSTTNQRNLLVNYNSNVHISLDFMYEEYPRIYKDIKTSNSILNIFWEGKIFSVHHLNLLNKLSSKFKKRIHFHIVTDLEKTLIPFIYILKANKILRRFKFNFTLYKWSIYNVLNISNHCDIGVIPLYFSDKKAINKPENKLLLMWRLGLPVITTKTAAYKHAMIKGDLKYFCSSIKEWESFLNYFINIECNNKTIEFNKFQNILNNSYSKDEYLLSWYNIFKSIGYNINDFLNLTP